MRGQPPWSLIRDAHWSGDNARLIEKPLPDTVRTVSNEDGITGMKVWDKAMDQSFTGVPSAFVTVA